MSSMSSLFPVITNADWARELKRSRAYTNSISEQIKRKMKDNLTDITILLDRSGSMQSIKDDTIWGFNAFLDEQLKAPGEAILGLHQFNHDFETRISARPIHEAKPLDSSTFVPRGNTALLDAIGRAVNETGDRLKAIPEASRPNKVVFVIITDGRENASNKFSHKQIKEMVDLQQNTYKWQFVFLGANIDSFAVAGSLGVNVANSMDFAANSIGTQSMYAATTDNLKAFRSGLKPDMSYTVLQKDIQKKAGA